MPSEPTFHYPPLHHHTSSPLSPSLASKPLSAYLEKSLTRPYLHPDAWLSLEGVRHGPKSGPQGSWALHHLRRIEAGMRGEVLAVESTEELVGKFGEEVVGEAMGRRQIVKKSEEEGDGEDDDERGEDEQQIRQKTKQAPSAPAAKPEHLMTKAEKKKARRAAEKAEIARAREKGEEVPSFGKKRKRNNNDQSEVDGQSQNGDSLPDHHMDINDPSQYTSAESHALAQEPLLEELGERDPAGVDREDAVKVPVVVEHDVEGDVIVPSAHDRSQGEKNKKRKGSGVAGGGQEEKEARRAAKKARRKEGKKAKDLDVLMVDADDNPSTTTTKDRMEGGPSRKAKRAKREREMNGTSNNTTPVASKGERKDGNANGTPATSEKKAKKKAKKEKSASS